MTVAPLLSIGIIFKNEERCIERCLRSLEPLRQAVPCELIMADTGAEDGSRAVAEQYADEVFDFPWIDDFAAARNAVMDRCTGKWYLSVDCDEWLDTDFSELLAFLKSRNRADFAFVIQRNYFSAELEQSEAFNDFRALRVVRMAAGERYHGAIHESWGFREPAVKLTRTILHHDGYLFTTPEAAKKKTQRNMNLLRERLKEEPDSLRTLNQCIESGGRDADQTYYVRHAVEVVQTGRDHWQRYGGLIMRHAVEHARTREMPELNEWIDYAETQFPSSIYTLVDVHYTAFLAAYDDKEWEKAIRHGEAYCEGLRTLRAKNHSKEIEADLTASTIHSGSPIPERTLLIALANAYLQTGQSEKARTLLTGLEGETLSPDQVRNAVIALCKLHAETTLDAAPALRNFYRQIGQKRPDEQKQKARLAVFDVIATVPFGENYREEEKEHEGYRQPAYTAFAALADMCEAGRGAKIMMSADPSEMREWLLQVEDWQALPIEALKRALQAGVPFPLAEQPLNQEIMSGLAARLTHDENFAWRTALALTNEQEYPSLQGLLWTQTVVLAALRSFDWTLGKNKKAASAFFRPEKSKDEKPNKRPACTPEIGLAFIRRFASLEAAALPLLFAPQLLTEENAALLPPMHRWGLYCVRALESLDNGDPHEYLSILRRGLKACPGEKDMVQFLLDRFTEDTRPKADPELLALAEKVRSILAAYGPDNPAARAIRESPAYKQVAWIIEAEPAGQMVQ